MSTPIPDPAAVALANAASFSSTTAGTGGTQAGTSTSTGTTGTSTSTQNVSGGTTTTSTTITGTPAAHIVPLFGGGTTADNVWCGGTVKHPRNKPKSVNCYRPTNYRDMSKLETLQKSGLSASKHLYLHPGLKVGSVVNATLTAVMKNWKSETIQRGTESCFVIYDPFTNTESCLFDNYGRLDVKDGEKMIEDICVLGRRVKDPNGPGYIRLPVCPFEVENMSFAGFMIKNSLADDILTQVENDIGTEPQGITALLACVTAIQSNTSPAYRKLIKELESLKLTNEPGQDVHAHCLKVEDLARRIDAVPNLCSDLTTLVCYTFLHSCNKMFDAKAIIHYNDSETPQSIGWEAVMKDLKGAYDKELGLSQWGSAAKTKAEAEAQRNETDFKALTAQLNVLQQTVKTFASATGGSTKSTADGGGSKDKKKGDRDPTGPRRIPPAAGEPEVKVVDGVTQKWCGTCTWWTKGDGIHTTATHVSKKDKAAADALAAAGITTGAAAVAGAAQLAQIQEGGIATGGGLAIASVNVDTFPPRSRLQMIGSLFVASGVVPPPLPIPDGEEPDDLYCQLLGDNHSFDGNLGRCDVCNAPGPEGELCATCNDPDCKYAYPTCGPCVVCGDYGPTGNFCTDCEDTGAIYDSPPSVDDEDEETPTIQHLDTSNDVFLDALEYEHDVVQEPVVSAPAESWTASVQQQADVFFGDPSADLDEDCEVYEGDASVSIRDRVSSNPILEVRVPYTWKNDVSLPSSEEAPILPPLSEEVQCSPHKKWADATHLNCSAGQDSS